MPFNCQKKSSLLIPSGPPHDRDRKHLFVLITDRCANHSHLGVPICTIEPGVWHDDACVLNAGCHEFLELPSFAMYRFAKIMHHALVSRRVDLNEFIPKADVSDEVCEIIRNGLLESRFVPKLIKKYFEEEG
jgi:hypothetical protein